MMYGFIFYSVSFPSYFKGLLMESFVSISFIEYCFLPLLDACLNPFSLSYSFSLFFCILSSLFMICLLTSFLVLRICSPLFSFDKFGFLSNIKLQEITFCYSSLFPPILKLPMLFFNISI